MQEPQWINKTVNRCQICWACPECQSNSHRGGNPSSLPCLLRHLADRSLPIRNLDWLHTFPEIKEALDNLYHFSKILQSRSCRVRRYEQFLGFHARYLVRRTLHIRWGKQTQLFYCSKLFSKWYYKWVYRGYCARYNTEMA